LRHPAPRKRGRGTAPRSGVVEGARAATILRRRQRSTESDAPSTTLRVVPLPRLRGGGQALPSPRRVFRGRAVKSNLSSSAPDECGAFLSASLRQLRKRKRNADRRGEQPPHRPGAAPPHPMGWEGQPACRRPTAALAKGTYVTQGATQAMFPATRSGRCYLPSPVPVQRAPRAPVVMPADMIPKPPGNGPYPPARGHRTRSDFRNTFAKGVLHRASGGYVTTPGTNVKGIVVITVTRRRAD